MSTSGLARHLVKEGFLTDSDCQLIARDHSNTGAAFAKVVVALGILSEEKLAHYLKEKTKCPMIPHKEVCATHQDAEGAISLPLLQSLEVVPLELSGDTLTVAMADPLDQNTLQQLKFFTPYKIKPTIATFSSLYLSLENLIQGFSAQKTTLEKFLAHHKLAIPPSAPARPIEGASFRDQKPPAITEDTDDSEDDEDYDSYDDFGDESDDAFSSIDENDADIDSDDDLGEGVSYSTESAEAPEQAQDQDMGAHGGVATWDDSSQGVESLDADDSTSSEDVDFWDEVEGSGEGTEGESHTESLTAGKVELWDDDEPAPSSDAPSSSNTSGSNLEPGGSQLWDDDDGVQEEAQASEGQSLAASSQDEDDMDLWSALEDGDPGSPEQAVEASQSPEVAAVASQDLAPESEEMEGMDSGAGSESLEEDLAELDFDEDSKGSADELQAGGSEGAIEDELGDLSFDEESSSAGEDGLDGFSEDLEASVEAPDVEGGLEDELAGLSFDEENSSAGDDGLEEFSKDLEAPAALTETDGGLEDEPSDLQFEEEGVKEDDLEDFSEDLGVGNEHMDELETSEESLSSDENFQGIPHTESSQTLDSATQNKVELENFDELQNMDTQNSDPEEGLMEFGEELASLEGEPAELRSSSEEDLKLFDEEEKESEGAGASELYAAQQDVAIGYLNHGIAGTSLAFTPVKAQEAAQAALIKAGLPRGLILRFEGEELSYLSHWNEASVSIAADIKAINLSLEDIPSAKDEQLWLNLEPMGQGLEILIGDSKHELRVHWGKLKENASAVTVASWSDKAFHGEQLEVLSAKLVDQLARKVM